MSADPIFGKLVGGALCLDFVNTVRGRVDGGEGRVLGERLGSYDALLRWGELAGALTARQKRAVTRQAARRRPEAAAVLARGIALREALYRLFRSVIAHRAPRREDLALLNRELRIARAHERLAGSRRFELVWDDDRPALDRVLWEVVRSAAALVTSDDLERLGRCPGPECGWLFLDASRSRRRQWCSMADCGNVAKVRRFRRKHRS